MTPEQLDKKIKDGLDKGAVLAYRQRLKERVEERRAIAEKMYDPTHKAIALNTLDAVLQLIAEETL